MKSQKVKNIVQIHKLDVTTDLPEFIELDIKKIVHSTFEQEKNYKPYQLAIILTSDRQIKELNLRYLNKNQPTDILCFPYSTGKIVTADIFISVERAKSQAKNYNHFLKQEILFLVVHGILHLFGWRDDSESARKKMWERQEQIIKRVKELES